MFLKAQEWCIHTLSHNEGLTAGSRAALCSQKIFFKNKNLSASKVQIKIVQVTQEVLDKDAALMFAVMIYQPQANLTIMKAPPPPLPVLK